MHMPFGRWQPHLLKLADNVKNCYRFKLGGFVSKEMALTFDPYFLSENLTETFLKFFFW